MPTIELINVVKSYGTGSTEVLALRGINFTANNGELIAIMGPSGSGKTTLLSIIGGLIRPTAGTVKLNNVDLGDLSMPELDELRLTTIGFVFQSLNLIPSLTALENVELPMLANDVDFGSAKRKAMDLLGIVDLDDRAHHKPGELSGGEQQRVAIAAALANDPPIILADEPTGNLDSKNTRNLMTYFRRLSREFNKAVIVVTHDPLVATSSDYICTIRDGLIESKVQPSEFEHSSEMGYSDYFRHRIQEIDEFIETLELRLRRGEISGKEYAQLLEEYTIIRKVLVGELSKLGNIEFAQRF